MSNTVRLLNGDCLQKLKELKDNSVDSVVTDPPYEIGFMGKGWDDSGIANNPQLWKEVLRVLKPGGHLLSFSHSRTYHRQAVAVEDAGFEIRDQIMWIYGSGFPKSHNIGKALDKNGGNGDLVYEVAEKLKQARESRGISKTQADKLFCNGSTNYAWLEGRKGGVRLPEDELFQKIVEEWPELKPYQEQVKSANREVVGNYDTDMGGLGGERLGSKGGDITLPSTPIAQQYEGWGTALKPAHEPIVMARKPFKGTVAKNVLEHGTGGINIDGCRVGNELMTQTHRIDFSKGTKKGSKSFYEDSWHNGQYIETQPQTGRFPANIIFDEEAGKILDKQSGISKSLGGKGKISLDSSVNLGGGNNYFNYGDTGGASRFFYCPKASKKDRNSGLENKIKLNILWKNTEQEDLKVQLLVDTEHLAIKATEGFIAENKNDYAWNIELFGKLIMDQFHKDMTSTTKIKTNSITTSVIYNWLIKLLTKDWMEDVFLKKMGGTNLVENVESSNTKMNTIKVKKDGSNQSVKFVLGKELVEIRLEESKSTHPTVKPTDLMAYLVRLVTPKGGTVLDPFMGSGSTGKASVREGFNFIGIEREEEYMEIAKSRIEHEQSKNKHREFFE